MEQTFVKVREGAEFFIPERIAALLGPFFNNRGTAFDNAKKMIEDAGREGTLEHPSAVIGDTVEDPLKDVAGPALIIFIELTGVGPLLIAEVIRESAGFEESAGHTLPTRSLATIPRP